MTDPDPDFGDAGDPVPVLIAAVVATALVTLVSVPLLGLNWTQALLTGGLAGVIAAVAAVLGRRHAIG